jgi:antirestriction protein ArdC
MTKQTKTNIYELITNRVIEGLEEKGLKWFRPWAGSFNGPMNHTTEKNYTGFNIFWLNMVKETEGYESNEWLTYKQGQNIGAKLKKGETAKDKSQFVVYWAVSYKHKKTGVYYNSEAQLKKAGVKPSECNKFFSMRSFYVFNIAQFENLEPKRKATDAPVFSPIEEAEKIYNNYENKPTLSHRGSQAFYQPMTHAVTMPEKDSFLSSDDYYKTLFHELTHSTGHESGLKRKGIVEFNGFGTEVYSNEELIAELGSEYLTGITGIKPTDDSKNSQAYINGWIKRLKDSDPKTIVVASQQAIKAVNYMLGE